MRGEFYKPRHVPHVDRPGSVQFVTFRLADSLPSNTNESEFDDVLDKGLGRCVLKIPECASIVVEALRWGDAKRYDLYAWTVMPNHVHVLFLVREGFNLARVVQAWKSITSRRIGALLGDKGVLWQKDYYDRWVRGEAHLQRAMEYIGMNPVAAGLCSKPEDWPYTWCLGWGTYG